jgi:hypothetical protein
MAGSNQLPHGTMEELSQPDPFTLGEEYKNKQKGPPLKHHIHPVTSINAGATAT